MTTCNVHKAAALLCVHPRTIFDLIHAGAIPAAKIGRFAVGKRLFLVGIDSLWLPIRLAAQKKTAT